jgi:hypothetical protein
VLIREPKMNAMSSNLGSSSPSASPIPFPHFAGDRCPTCDQVIPHDHFEEIQNRIQARQQEQADHLTARLEATHRRDLALVREQAERDASEAVRLEREAGNERIEAARAEERRSAAADADKRLAAGLQKERQENSTLQAKLAELRATEGEAKASRQQLQSQLEEQTRAHAAELASLTESAAAREAEIRTEAEHEAAQKAQKQIEEFQNTHAESIAEQRARIERAEAEKAAAEQLQAALEVQLQQASVDKLDALAKAQQESAQREATALQRGRDAAEADLQQRVVDAGRQKEEAEARAASSAAQLAALKAAHQTELAERLEEQREALEQDKAAAVNAQKSAAFEESLKWKTKAEDLARALEKKNSEDLGEGAEVDLYDSLRGEFTDDRIERIAKGTAGADISQTVIYNGQECGGVIFDSKNHNAWRNEFVSKLAVDKLAAKADVAILCTRKFPEGKRHLHVQDGVIVVDPVRAVTVVEIVRQHLIQMHSLRLSQEERAHKTSALYHFITSQPCTDLLDRIENSAEDLLELQTKEQRAHELTWRKQGELIRSVQKARADLSNHIETIIGTATSADCSESE